MDRFTVQARTSGTQAVVVVTGELDVSTSPAFRDKLRTVIADGAKRLVIDLRRVTFIESVALGVFISARRQLGGADKCLCVVLDPSQTSIRKVFQVTGLDQVFPVHSSQDAAEGDCEPPAA